MAEVQALYNAVAMLTAQVQQMAELSTERAGGGSKKLDNFERYENLAIFSGDVKLFEEWSVVSKVAEPCSCGGCPSGSVDGVCGVGVH